MVKVARWGNSLAVRIPAQVAEVLDLNGSIQKTCALASASAT
jgi:antitoxin component of MazEF toxin-antitoxin module